MSDGISEILISWCCCWCCCVNPKCRLMREISHGACLQQWGKHFHIHTCLPLALCPKIFVFLRFYDHTRTLALALALVKNWWKMLSPPPTLPITGLGLWRSIPARKREFIFDRRCFGQIGPVSAAPLGNLSLRYAYDN